MHIKARSSEMMTELVKTDFFNIHESSTKNIQLSYLCIHFSRSVDSISYEPTVNVSQVVNWDSSASETC